MVLCGRTDAGALGISQHGRQELRARHVCTAEGIALLSTQDSTSTTGLSTGEQAAVRRWARRTPQPAPPPSPPAPARPPRRAPEPCGEQTSWLACRALRSPSGQ